MKVYKRIFIAALKQKFNVQLLNLYIKFKIMQRFLKTVDNLVFAKLNK